MMQHFLNAKFMKKKKNQRKINEPPKYWHETETLSSSFFFQSKSYSFIYQCVKSGYANVTLDEKMG